MRQMKEENLTKLYDFIHYFARENNGESPSLGEMTAHMKMSKSTTYRHVLELERRGMVTYHGKRTLETDLQRKMRCGVCRIPVVGEIICGSPEEQEESVSEYLAIPKDWVKGECFLLRAYGDSMADIGIATNDLVQIRRTETANDGDVVVALTEDGNTLKRLFWENGRPRLHAENRRYRKPDIYPERLTVQGVALKVIKDIR